MQTSSLSQAPAIAAAPHRDIPSAPGSEALPNALGSTRLSPASGEAGPCK